MLKRERDASEDVTECISFAVGSAVYDRKTDTCFQDVFERADKCMYNEKQKMHESDGITSTR